MTAMRDPQGASARLLADLVAEPSPAAGELPPGLRDSVLSRVRALGAQRPLPRAEDVPGPVAPFVHQIEAVDALASTVRSLPVARQVIGEWTSADVLAHLIAVDALAARTLGLPTPPETGSGDDVESRTASVQLGPIGASIELGLRVWRQQASALARHGHAVGEAGMAESVDYLGLTLTRADVLLDRAFETWIHLEDLRASAGVEGVVPDARDIALMSDFGARILVETWPATASPEDPPVVLALSGIDAGSWTLPGVALHPSADLTTVTLDAVDFCRLAGGRADRRSVPHAVDGDPALASRVLQAAGSLARI